MKMYEVEVEARTFVKVEAENEEDAKSLVMENPEVGEQLLQSAEVTDVGECDALVSKTDSEEKNGN